MKGEGAKWVNLQGYEYLFDVLLVSHGHPNYANTTIESNNTFL